MTASKLFPEIRFGRPGNWRQFNLPKGGDLWLAGPGPDDIDEVALCRLLGGADRDAAIGILRGLRGRHALILRRADWSICLVDRVASYPLCIALGRDGPVVTDGNMGIEQAGIELELDTCQHAAIALAGFSMGSGTLFRNVRWLLAGEAIVLEAGHAPQSLRLHRYAPTPDAARRDPDDPDLLDECLRVHRRVVERSWRQAAGRPIWLPISAGLDSRLILSLLAEMGASNITCFTYGLSGNHESEAAIALARKLGYACHVVELTLGIASNWFRSDAFDRFSRFADSLAAMPFHQDALTLTLLLERELLPADAVVINGQSGDFTSGNHIPRSLWPENMAGKEPDEQVRALRAAYLDKHLALWRGPRVAGIRRLAEELVDGEIATLGRPDGTAGWAAHAYEMIEHENRQSKYVVSGQRSYEWLGLGWSLPLWDDDLADFWQAAPLQSKLGQSLYRRALTTRNPAGVWGSDFQFPRRVRPASISALRALVRIGLAPIGKAVWHELERRLFAWPSDIVCNYAIVPYAQAFREGAMARNALSFHADAYLQRHSAARALDMRPDV